MLIFDFGEASPQADAFAQACRENGKDAWVWADQEALHEGFQTGAPGADIFPFQLYGAVVTVERDDNAMVEASFMALVGAFGGQYAGT